MSGDAVRDAFRSETQTILTALGITWSLIDTFNTTQQPDAASPFIQLEFGSTEESQYTSGAPGYNLFREDGMVLLAIAAPLGQEGSADTYAEQIRGRFRERRFAAGSRSVLVTSASPMGGGRVAGGMWIEYVALRYETFNVG